MNYLAHQFLSGKDEDIRAGNFMADFIKGNKYESLPQRIQIGIKLHREIDWYTDTHPEVDNLKASLRPYFGKYAGVACDLYFDYCLANSWNEFHDEELKSYCDSTYIIMQNYVHHFPDRLKHMFGYMKRDNWLYHYRLAEGIGRSMRGLSSRTKFESGLEKGKMVLEDKESVIFETFKKFFPDLLEEITKKRNELIEEAR